LAIAFWLTSATLMLATIDKVGSCQPQDGRMDRAV
jgi:hypothetical protein